MNKKFELLREAVNTYKVNHCDGNKNEKALLQFIDELEQLTIPVVGRSEQFNCPFCNSTNIHQKTKSNDWCKDCEKEWAV